MSDKSKHGGSRLGAGRKSKWTFDDILRIGQACEKRWKAAEAEAFHDRKTEITSRDTELDYFWRGADRVPLQDRKGWRESDLGKFYLDEVEAEIAMLNQQHPGPEPTNVFNISTKPPRGTRKSIIEEVASEFGLSVKQVDNIWQRYREYERKMARET
jgi:hypothetical protein